MPVTGEGITGHAITEEEFRLLRYLSSDLYIGSSNLRFTGWGSSFNPKHPDWPFRVTVQSALASLVANNFTNVGETSSRVLFIGASLGAIATYFHFGEFRRLGLMDQIETTILDYLEEPLERTIKGEFEFPRSAEEDCRLNAPHMLTAAEYRELIKSAKAVATNATKLPFEVETYDVVVAPFLHHHLNIYDKRRACAEMLRITRPGGLVCVGDLTFSFEEFSSWLAKHSGEQMPYAVESFLSMDEHIDLFEEATPCRGRYEGENFYSFVLSRT